MFIIITILYLTVDYLAELSILNQTYVVLQQQVREIQLRQQNWLKERAAETAGDSDGN